MAVSIFDGGLPKCKDYFLHKFSKKIPARMKAVNYSRKGNKVQWNEVKPCSAGVVITWLAKFHPDVVKARELEIKYCWADLPLFCSEDSKGYSRKEIRCFLLDSIVIDCWSELFHLIVQKNYPHIKTWTCAKFRNESGRIYAFKNYHKTKLRMEMKMCQFKKKVPLWNYLEGLESKLTVACTEFKPVLILEPLHVQRAKNCFNTFAGFNYKYDPNFKVDESKFNLILHHICEV